VQTNRPPSIPHLFGISCHARHRVALPSIRCERETSIPHLFRHSTVDPSTSDGVAFTDWVLDVAMPRVRAQRLVSWPKRRLNGRAAETGAGFREIPSLGSATDVLYHPGVFENQIW